MSWIHTRMLHMDTSHSFLLWIHHNEIVSKGWDWNWCTVAMSTTQIKTGLETTSCGSGLLVSVLLKPFFNRCVLERHLGKKREKKRAIQWFSGVDEQGFMSQVHPPACFYLRVQMYLSACFGWSVNLRWVTAGINKYSQSWRCGQYRRRNNIWVQSSECKQQ